MQNLQRTNEKQKEKISEYEQQILENEGRILLGKRKDAKYQYKLKKSDNLKNSTSNTILVVLSVDWNLLQCEVQFS